MAEREVRIGSFRYVPPETVEACEQRQLEVASRASSIRAQLSNPNRTDNGGERLTVQAYQKWRTKATYALAALETEQSYLKQWKKDRRRTFDRLIAAQEFNVRHDDAFSLLAGLLSLVRGWVADRQVEIDEGEQAFLDVIREHLINKIDVKEGEKWQDKELL